MKAVRIRLADGTELPTEQVGKDPVRDLAFFAPVQSAAAKGRTFTYVDLHQAAESAVVLGDCLHLMRLGDTMQRIAVVRPGSIIAVRERPRRLFVTSTDLYTEGVGCPVFDAEGRVLGICLRFMDNDIPHSPVVVPAADVAEQAGNL